MGKKLFIGVPIYGSVNPDFYQCMLNFTQQNAIPCMLSDRLGDSLVPRARNSLTRKFLESDCTDLLFIDSDLVFSSAHVARILERDEPLIGGLYPKKKQGQVEWVINGLDELTAARPDHMIKVKYVGTGFMKVSRCVFERMLKAFGSEMAYISDEDHKTVEHDFWHCGVYEYPNGYRRYLSEDWWFCQMWSDLGGEVWADQSIVLKHSGAAVYPLQSQEHEIFHGCRKAPGNTAAGDSAFPTAVPAAELSPRIAVPA